jgi:DNA polymerase-1
VWHNYGFDRHMMGNHGIDVRGFGGGTNCDSRVKTLYMTSNITLCFFVCLFFRVDTMHMARLWDAARLFGGGGYSLEGLTRDLLSRTKTSMTESNFQHFAAVVVVYESNFFCAVFGVKRVLQDGTEGAETIMPELDYLQRYFIDRVVVLMSVLNNIC